MEDEMINFLPSKVTKIFKSEVVAKLHKKHSI